jgi:2-oxoglutarate dehydrogenase E2 component (dihydrolipoamide succinyltransferase)
MTIEIKVPVLAESIEDAALLGWRKAAGDQVEQGEILTELETDKVVLEVNAPESGVLVTILQEEGAVLKSGEVLAMLEPGEVSAVAAVEEAVTEEVPEALSPAVRKLVEENHLDTAMIKGSGKDGRLTKGDILSYLDTAKVSSKTAPMSAPKVADPEVVPSAPVSSVGNRIERRVPMTRLRAKIAERLLQAQQSAAILTTFNEVNMAPVMALRKTYKERFEKTHGVKLGFMSFFTRAAVAALQKFPAVNASIDGNDMVYHDYCDVGIAISSPRGLVVPVIRNTEDLGFAGIEQSILNYALQARDGKLAIEDMMGGTFSITNGGTFGSLLSTPILNPPQSAILGMHKIQEKPMAENGQVVIRPMMYLALSYDHRIIDGREAVQFLVAIKDALEDPARLLLEV